MSSVSGSGSLHGGDLLRRHLLHGHIAVVLLFRSSRHIFYDDFELYMFSGTFSIALRYIEEQCDFWLVLVIVSRFLN